MVGLLTVHLHLPGAGSLKEKRSRVRPILVRLHREFNVSAAEVDLLDAHQETVIACVLASNEASHIRQALEHVLEFLEAHWPDEPVLDHTIEIL